MHELKRKMMLMLMGLLSALSLLLVAAFDLYSYETASQDLSRSLSSLSDLFRSYQGSRFGPWFGQNEPETDFESISLIYENPAWMVSFTYKDQIEAIYATDPEPIPADEIAALALSIQQSHQPSTQVIGSLAGNGMLALYPSRQQMVLIDVSRVQVQLLVQLVVSALIFLIFEAALYFVCRRLTQWMIGPMEQSLEKQKQFIADASHELKTPVAVIQANAEAMEHDPDVKWLRNIEEETVRMNGLITDLLDLARSESQPIEREPVDLSRLVEKQTMIQEARIFENHLELEESIDPGLFVSGQASMLEQIAAILIDNAIEHSDGEIRVTVSLKGKNVLLSVANTGVPIPPELRERIFERFFRADAARSRNGGRYGLGLAIARALVERHDGSIEVRCQDGWTAFTVTLPAAKI